MDLVNFPSPTKFRNRTLVLDRSLTVPLILGVMATILSVVSLILSSIQQDRSRSFRIVGRHQEGQSSRSTGSGETCLPCSDVMDETSSLAERVLLLGLFSGGHGVSGDSPTQKASRNEHGRWRDSEDLCCARNRNQLLLLLQLFVKLRDKKSAEQEVLETKKCIVFHSVDTSAKETRCIMDRNKLTEYAHVTGLDLDRLSEVGSGALNWTESVLPQGTVKNVHGRLTTDNGGIYFVYAQIYFAERIEDPASDDLTIHVIIRRHIRRTKRMEVITERVQRRCSKATLASASVCEYSIYAGSLVELSPADSVSVSASHSLIINDDAKLTYFGLHRVT